MKKTLITALLLAASVAAYAETTKYTVSSTTTSLQTDTIVGWSMDLSDSCYTTTNASNASATLPSSVSLSSLTVATNTGNLKLAIYTHPGHNNNVGYWDNSENNRSLFLTGDFQGLSTGTTTANGQTTFTFDSLTLNSSQVYLFLFVDSSSTKDNISTWSGYTAHDTTAQVNVFNSSGNHRTDTDFTEGVWVYTNDSSKTHFYENVETTDALLFNSRKRNAIVSYSVQSIPTDLVPEPATATLSLLALAGLAARRRRK